MSDQRLRHPIELFCETGGVFHVPGELFSENSRVQVMLGQAVVLHRHHPAADVMSTLDLKRFLDEIRVNVVATADRRPAPVDYMRLDAPADRPD